MSLTEVNLKDENYLKEYEAHIRKLPLEELYDIFEIVKKDESPERINIVLNAIKEQDEDWEDNIKFHSMPFALQYMENVKGAVKAIQDAVNPKDKEISSHPKDKEISNYSMSKLTEEEQAEVRQTVNTIHENAKKTKKETKREIKENHIKSLLSWLFWCPIIGFDLMSRYSGGYKTDRSAIYYLPEHDPLETLQLTPFFCLVIGFLIAKASSRTKDNAIHLAVAAFLLMKATLGFTTGAYFGLFYNLFKQEARIASVIIFITTMLFACNLYLQKSKNRLATHAILPLSIALLLEVIFGFI